MLVVALSIIRFFLVQKLVHNLADLLLPILLSLIDDSEPLPLEFLAQVE